MNQPFVRHYFHSTIVINTTEIFDDYLLHNKYFYDKYVYFSEFGPKSYLVPIKTIYTRYKRLTETEYES